MDGEEYGVRLRMSAINKNIMFNNIVGKRTHGRAIFLLCVRREIIGES